MVISGYRQPRVVTPTDGWQLTLPALSGQQLFLSDQHPQASAALSRYRDYLGHEFYRVIIDCQQQLHVDAIAALTGTIIAGGELVLLADTHNSPMWQRLTENWRQLSPVTTPPELPAILPTEQQQQVLEQLQDATTTHVVTAPRGRGKSHVLGQAIAAKQTACPQQRIIVTAPRKANARVLLNQAPQVQFVAWDKLIATQKGDALLVIDEAAGLPLWAIQQLCHRYTPWLLATTVDGYEGCGRGFAVHFTEWSQQQFDSVSFHRLTTPLRWPIADPLERWLEQALMMQPAAPLLSSSGRPHTAHASDLSEDILHQAFELLLNAHYQSSPNDLALLLNDPNQFLTLEYQSQRVVGVSWNAIEGPLPEQLRQPIIQGRRRPKGNLLPQAIGYFLQQPWALEKRWCRIVRIAVAADMRRRHIASDMIEQVKHWAQKQQCDAIGTSFGYSAELGHIWQLNGFMPIRTSSRRDRVSARFQQIRVCWLSSPPELWSALFAYGQAELDWVLHDHMQPGANNTVAQNINDAVVAGYLPATAARFAQKFN